MRPLDGDMATRAIRLYVDDRLTPTDVGRRLHSTAERVRATLAANGVPLRKRGRPADLTDLDRVASLYRSGMSLAEVADVVGFSASAVAYALRRHGTPRRPALRRPVIGAALLRQMIDQRHSVDAMALLTGTSPTTVRRAIGRLTGGTITGKVGPSAPVGEGGGSDG